MQTLMLIIAGVLGAVVVLVVVLAAMLGWSGLYRLQRVGLCMIVAGLVGAGADRALQRPVGLFDILMLAGLLLYLVRTYGPAIWQRADALDGTVDGQLRLPGIDHVPARTGSTRK